jgi:hypothetical protein
MFQRARELAYPLHSPRHHHLFFPCPPFRSFPPSIPLLRSEWSLRNPLPPASPSRGPPLLPCALRFGSGACLRIRASLDRVWAMILGISASLGKGGGNEGDLASMRCSRLVSSLYLLLMRRILAVFLGLKFVGFGCLSFLIVPGANLFWIG